MSQIDTVFHESIAQRRSDLGMTQSEVEIAGDLRFGLVSYIETRRMKRLPLPDVLLGLGRALEFTPADLLELSGYLFWSEADVGYLEARLSEVSRIAA